MSVSIEGSGSITGVSTFYNATFSGITTFADNIDFDGNITGVTTFLGVGVTSLNVLGVSTFTGQLNAGTISATTLSATTVSIAGTLTYQDVTNVDSIGIVTARNGIDVTSGTVTITTATNSASATGGGDNLVIKDSDDCGLSILSGNGNSQNIYLGSVSDNDGVRLQGFYNSGSPYFKLYTAGSERLSITSAGLIDASSNTSAVALPQGTTAQRPTGSAPYIRKNTTNNALEYYDGTSWVEIITDYFPTGSVIFS